MSEKLSESDLQWLSGLMENGHCGEGTADRVARERLNARINRLLNAARAEARPAPAVDREAVARVLYERHPAVRFERDPKGGAPLNRAATWDEATADERADDYDAADDILALLSPATSPGEGSSGANRAARIASDHAASEAPRKSEWVCNSCGAPFSSSDGKIVGGTCPNGRPTCPLVPA